MRCGGSTAMPNLSATLALSASPVPLQRPVSDATQVTTHLYNLFASLVLAVALSRRTPRRVTWVRLIHGRTVS